MGMFAKNFNATDAERKEQEKSFLEREIKRKFGSAWDDSERKKIEAEKRLMSLQADNFQRYDINSVLEARQEIAIIEEVQDLLKEEFKAMFDTELPIS